MTTDRRIHHIEKRLRWYQTHQWSRANARMLEATIDSAEGRDDWREVERGIDGFDELIDDLKGMLREYKKIARLAAEAEKLERVAVANARHDEILSRMAVIRRQVEDRATHYKSAGWRNRKVREWLEDNDEWRALRAEVSAMQNPDGTMKDHLAEV